MALRVLAHLRRDGGEPLTESGRRPSDARRFLFSWILVFKLRPDQSLRFENRDQTTYVSVHGAFLPRWAMPLKRPRVPPRREPLFADETARHELGFMRPNAVPAINVKTTSERG